MINSKIFTEDEKAILRSFPSPFKWIARDRDGWLSVYEDKPKRDGIEFISGNPHTEYAGMEIFKHIFKGVTFENSPIRFRGEVLDEVEKAYLKSVFSPFRNMIVSVRKMDLDLDLDRPGQCINVTAMMDNRIWMWCFPPFEAGTMYKGMTVNEEYSLEDLGIRYD